MANFAASPQQNFSRELTPEEKLKELLLAEAQKQEIGRAPTSDNSVDKAQLHPLVGYSGPTAEEVALQRELEKQFQANQEQLGQDVQLQRNLAMSQYNKPAPVDNSASTAGWFDVGGMTPDQIQKTVEHMRPESEEDRAEKLRKLLEGTSNAQDKLSDNKLNELRYKLQFANQRGGASRANQQQSQTDNRYFTAFQKELGSLNKDYQDVSKSLYATNQALQPDAQGMVSLDNVSSNLSNISRIMGEKGVLTDADLQRQIKTNVDAVLGRVQQFFSKNPHATKVPASYVAGIMSNLRRGEESLKRTAAGRLKDVETRYSDVNSPSANMYYNRGGKNILDSSRKTYNEENITGAKKSKQQEIEDIKALLGKG